LYPNWYAANVFVDLHAGFYCFYGSVAQLAYGQLTLLFCLSGIGKSSDKRFVQELIHRIELLGGIAPLVFLLMYVLGSALMLWRLSAMHQSGGTSGVLGLMLLPFATAFGNILFAWYSAAHGGEAEGVVVSCLTNNLTGVLLLTGIVAFFWKLEVAKESGDGSGEKNQKSEGGDQKRVQKLWILTALIAILFFTCLVWVIGIERGQGRSLLQPKSNTLQLSVSDALILLATFIFWEIIYLIEALKVNKPEKQPVTWRLVLNITLVLIGAVVCGEAAQWLITYAFKGGVGVQKGAPLGIVVGLITAIPNAMVAFYYGWKKKPEIVYGVQATDANVCIPFCLVVFLLMGGKAITLQTDMVLGGLIALLGGVILQIMFLGSVGKIPRPIGALLILMYFVGLGILATHAGLIKVQ